ncbi:MAG: aminotransferase class V-fold PLP-dependent enzyme [Alcanivoracaceae bacterium]|nr:aminotransferase class V-fold PLP-dependent enzyme [Alcanivoracaceae bacterium]
MKSHITPEYLRQNIIGVDAPFCTPFGQRLMLYGDYTASGRTLNFIEKYLMRLQRHYANTHTEDDMTGRSMTHLLHSAEETIKECVNAGDDYKIINVGTGATGAINKLQQILGVYLPPATRKSLQDNLAIDFSELKDKLPVVFVGPYEHHSNEISWRDGLCQIVEVGLDENGHIDLAHLQKLLESPEYADRKKIGSFSAASNVTGLISPVHEIAALLHKHDTLALFDYAASAPYVEINMQPDDATPEHNTSLDAVFISAHKFLGGPGSSGVLVFNQSLYNSHLPPTVSGGGTVSYVAQHMHDFFDDIEEREKAGTPGVLQILRAALCFRVKDEVGTEQIAKIEHEWLEKVFSNWQKNDLIEILGDKDINNRVGIVSFNVKTASGKYLHPKFVTVLLNDLFGIQSRAGCSCAGPYGHRLLNIDEKTSESYRDLIQQGFHGIKPGWCRIGFHYVMDDADVDFIIKAVEFIAAKGELFLPWYDFCLKQACWKHINETADCPELKLDDAFDEDIMCPSPVPSGLRRQLYTQFIAEANKWAEKGKDLPKRKTNYFEEVAHLNQFLV